MEPAATSAAKTKNLLALIMSPVWRWRDSALNFMSRLALVGEIPAPHAN
jgi:hypothetical protein